MRENIVQFGRELGATLEVYVATFCIFCNFLATFRILHSNFSHFLQQLFRNLRAQSPSMPIVTSRGEIRKIRAPGPGCSDVCVLRVF